MLIETLPPEVAHALEGELRVGWELDQTIAKLRAGDVGRVASEVAKSVDGLGECVARVDNISFHYWGKRLGYDCWNDKQFMKEYLRDNPQSRTRSGGTRIQVGYR